MSLRKGVSTLLGYKRVLTPFLLFLLILFSIQAHSTGNERNQPSFSCRHAATSAEHKICMDRTLSTMDNQVAALYDSFYFANTPFKQTHEQWKRKRNECLDKVCLKKFYQNRIKELKQALSNERTYPQFVLDAMRLAETQFKLNLKWLYPEDEQYIQNNQRFLTELFTFQNIRFKAPVVARVQYDDRAFQALLGECAGYRFDRYFGHGSEWPVSFFYEIDREDATSRAHAERYEFGLDFTAWRVRAQNTDWLLLKTSENRSRQFLVNPDLCEQDSNKSLVDAISRKEIWTSTTGVDYLFVVEYKGKDYMFDATWFDNDSIHFGLDEILSYFPLDNNALRFKGASIYYLTFETK